MYEEDSCDCYECRNKYDCNPCYNKPRKRRRRECYKPVYAIVERACDQQLPPLIETIVVFNNIESVSSNHRCYCPVYNPTTGVFTVPNDPSAKGIYTMNVNLRIDNRDVADSDFTVYVKRGSSIISQSNIVVPGGSISSISIGQSRLLSCSNTITVTIMTTGILDFIIPMSTFDIVKVSKSCY